MTTQSTTKTQINKLNKAGRGDWVRFMGDYVSNAYSYAEDGTYQLIITKEDGRWFVSAEDHDAEDIDGNPENGFCTLAEAKEFAEEFGEFFEDCAIQNL